MRLPKQVIEQLMKYLDDGCDIDTTIEEIHGVSLKRWVVNNRVIIWSELATPKEGEDTQE